MEPGSPTPPAPAPQPIVSTGVSSETKAKAILIGMAIGSVITIGLTLLTMKLTGYKFKKVSKEE